MNPDAKAGSLQTAYLDAAAASGAGGGPALIADHEALSAAAAAYLLAAERRMKRRANIIRMEGSACRSAPNSRRAGR